MNLWMQYRPEIDGLRAAAVIPVILFHAMPQYISGGFVGVDVFFVISGYLITTIILTEMEAGKFSLTGFYERRARRILPAMFFVIICFIPFAWFWLPPRDMLEFARTIIAVSLFGSNFLFWKQDGGYFDTTMDVRPFLHSWSLAVEEQYYILFPLFLLVLWRLGRGTIVAILAIAGLVSLLLAQWGIGEGRSGMGSFYLLPARGWEILLGSFVSFFLFKRERPVKASQWASLLGFVMIIIAIFVYDESTVFPGFSALLPTLGTVLILLFATKGTLLYSFLSWRPMVLIGLISYSAYLWHYPIFVFAQARSPVPINNATYMGLTLLSLALAYGSWRYIEAPFRRRHMIRRNTIFSLAGGCTLVLVLFGLGGYATNGMYWRPTLEQNFGLRWKPNTGLHEACMSWFSPDRAQCKTHKNPKILLWGDSYAAHLASALRASNPDARFIQVTNARCGAFFGFAPRWGELEWSQQCVSSNDRLLKWLKEAGTIKYALISTAFNNYLSPGRRVYSRKEGDRQGSYDETLREFLRTLKMLQNLGIKPVIVSEVPFGEVNAGRCVEKNLFYNRDLSQCNFDLGIALRHRSKTYRLLELLEKDYRVLWLKDTICRNEVCIPVTGSGVVLYHDGEHLSFEGSAYIGRKTDLYNFVTGSDESH